MKDVFLFLGSLPAVSQLPQLLVGNGLLGLQIHVLQHGDPSPGRQLLDRRQNREGGHGGLGSVTSLVMC